MTGYGITTHPRLTLEWIVYGLAVLCLDPIAQGLYLIGVLGTLIGGAIALGTGDDE